MGTAVRYALSIVQGVMALFTTGTVLYETHQLFLRYYYNEWMGLLISGVNDCRGIEMIANGDIIGGQTFCNHPENFVPWIEVYKHHPYAAAAYYGTALGVLTLIGGVWYFAQRRRPAIPADQAPHGSVSDKGII